MRTNQWDGIGASQPSLSKMNLVLRFLASFGKKELKMFTIWHAAA